MRLRRIAQTEAAKLYDGMSHLAVFLIKMALMNAGCVGVLCGYLTFREAAQDEIAGPIGGTILGVLAVFGGWVGAMVVQGAAALFFYALIVAW